MWRNYINHVNKIIKVGTEKYFFSNLFLNQTTYPHDVVKKINNKWLTKITKLPYTHIHTTNNNNKF
ncbi:MAG: hypothetical protein UT07_C0003G0015 [Parcubacteria group bacterium GW2011_GWB1_38_8]|uniref:Uncharacterized protein n=1 Tax=Candidatus Zambryskibacteria bacterium RIFCSPLOWO2_02_FULL_39_14 TaxID=1802769 RepID=A0A1G2UHX2_9BACT|nr:MAG: hypothetical protein UT07_C0003G0015 [Parcubacteria group bacterium GW2011_GWB1_38_8]KKR30854.1 MAG: hypothetical protein UT62_C0006G0012 [Parcubacteria group bacterium GW2011_GWC1_39_8]OHA95173.1 MAG: hypothetical protein A3C62_01105 [Candidatus Zambryskibacteria bacterium RIFCSPHIGHO2_02_FULL_39_16]OHB08782.1 MAG: hypothetical protein A3I86_02010 [Candidatus Zambryskibacteria bacterium RIFCSPLOWO2_02_FULL_39_14]